MVTLAALKRPRPFTMGNLGNEGRDGDQQPRDLENFLATMAQHASALGGSPYNPQLLQQAGGVTYAMLNNPHAQALLQQYQLAAASGSQAASEGPRATKRSAEGAAPRGRPSKRGRGRGRESAAADPVVSGSGDEGGPSSDRAQQLQEKNRRAQRRFRERQKTMVSELMTEVDELKGRVNTLQADKQSLTHHSNILQKVLGMKEEQVENMTQRLKSLEGQEAGKSDRDTLEVLDSDGVAVSVAKTGMQDKLTKVWREYVNKLAGCLVEGGANNPGSDIIDTINKLVRDAVSMYKKASLYDPSAMRKWFLSNMEEPGLEQSDKEIQMKWKSIVRSLALSGQQKEEIIELKRMRAEKLKGLNAEACRLAKLLSDGGFDMNPEEIPSTGRLLAKQYIQHSDVSARLRDNIEDRSNAQLEFDSTLFQGIFTPLQMARVMVQSYPLVPDSIALVNWACQ